jgi:hypothetical protein
MPFYCYHCEREYLGSDPKLDRTDNFLLVKEDPDPKLTKMGSVSEKNSFASPTLTAMLCSNL